MQNTQEAQKNKWSTTIWLRALMVLVLTMTFGAAAISANAQGPGDVVLGETSVTVPANGEATIRFQTFCLDFGLAFPSSLGTPDGRASDDVLRIIKAALEEDIPDQNPLAVQLAIWSTLENQTIGELYPDTEIPAQEAAQQLLDNAQDADLSPLAEDRGRSLTELVSEGVITATSEDFEFVDTENPRPDGEPYHGEGTLVLTNQTDEPVEVYFPYGVVFRASTDGEQDIVTYATELEQLPTATPMPTATPAPTNTPAPTPDTVPESGGPATPSSTPWLLIAIGVVLLSSASVLVARYQE